MPAEDNEKTFLNVGELLALNLKPPTYIWEGLIYCKGVNYIAGMPGIGKSLLATDLALHIAKGEPFLGRQVKKGTVILIDEENSLNSLADRVKKLNKLVQVDSNCQANAFVWTSSGLKLTYVGLSNLVEKIKELKPILVIFDSFIRFFSGDENSSKDVKLVFDAVKPLMDKYGTGFMFLHHTTKGIGRVTANSLRGSGDILASADSIIVLNNLPSGLVELEQVKCRHARLSEPIFFDLKAVKKDNEDALDLELVQGINPSTSIDAYVKEWISTNVPANKSFKSGELFRAFPAFSEKDIRDSLTRLARQGITCSVGRGKWLRLPAPPISSEKTVWK